MLRRFVCPAHPHTPVTTPSRLELVPGTSGRVCHSGRYRWRVRRASGRRAQRTPRARRNRGRRLMPGILPPSRCGCNRCRGRRAWRSPRNRDRPCTWIRWGPPQSGCLGSGCASTSRCATRGSKCRSADVDRCRISSRHPRSSLRRAPSHPSRSGGCTQAWEPALSPRTHGPPQGRSPPSAPWRSAAAVR